MILNSFAIATPQIKPLQDKLQETLPGVTLNYSATATPQIQLLRGTLTSVTLNSGVITTPQVQLLQDKLQETLSIVKHSTPVQLQRHSRFSPRETITRRI